MAERQTTTGSGKVGIPQDGHGVPTEKAQARYCATCGAEADVHGLATERFDEVFCSDGHAEEFVKAVRAAQIQTAATALPVPSSPTEVEKPEQQAACTLKQRDWKHYLKMGACCGAPLLALAFLAGGGGVLLGAAGALLPFVAALACPLGMYFLMRSMSKMGHQETPQGKDEKK